ncbi:hypothetical protein CAPSP0001_2428 [Capnocytophaga sputigena ATCC 33612]|nr:hypothetical protein CAPSP0001_2428 [Capnocytophaga sputigena ATCC 33612]
MSLRLSYLLSLTSYLNIGSFFLRKISLWNDFSYTFLRKAENYLFYETPIIL